MSKVFLCYNVYADSSVYFASKKRTGGLKILYANAGLLSTALTEFRKLLNFDQDVKVELDTLKGKNWYGCYDDNTRTACVRYSKSFRTMLLSLAHELVHAEQFRTGKLYFKSTGTRYVPYWCGKRNNSKDVANYYYDEPWEQEARNRQISLSTNVYINLFDHIHSMNSTMKEVL